MPNSESVGGTALCLTVSADALRASALDRVDRVDVNSYRNCTEDGWRENWVKDNVRVDTQSVTAAVDFVDSVIRRTSK
jgi:hypothetical protein